MSEDKLEQKDFEYLDQKLQAQYYTEYFFVRLMGAMEIEPRLALYLPFMLLRQAPKFFRDDYRRHWKYCLNHVELRCNFAPNAEPEEMIVKAAHLLPWLVDAHIYHKEEIAQLFHEAESNPLLYHSMADTTRLLHDRKYVSKDFAREVTAKDVGMVELLKLRTPKITPTRRRNATKETHQVEGKLIQDYLIKDRFVNHSDHVGAQTNYYAEIDGSSAFYDERLRRTASRLLIQAIALSQEG